jgi:hypothetical protein
MDFHRLLKSWTELKKKIMTASVQTVGITECAESNATYLQIVIWHITTTVSCSINLTFPEMLIRSVMVWASSSHTLLTHSIMELSPS